MSSTPAATVSLVKQALSTIDPQHFTIDETTNDDHSTPVPFDMISQVLSQLGLLLSEEEDGGVSLSRFQSTFCLDQCASAHHITLHDVVRLVSVMQRERDSMQLLQSELSREKYSGDGGESISVDLAQKLIVSNSIQLGSDEIDELLFDLDPNSTGKVNIETLVRLIFNC